MKFLEIVKEHSERLRTIPFEQLKGLANEPIEHLTVNSRPATIATIVEPLKSGGVRVVVQGFMNMRFFPGKRVALDGFYKYPDETMAPMPDEEFHEFD